ncbi:MAG: site-2 protease family protein [Deltaproteobacteria bacterium]|nr:site-2 protease family protein [Deltaproteobacteria bacterium]
MLSYLYAVIGLSILIAVHEFGHLLVALWMGMKVEVYSIGFGPRLFGFSHKGIDYRLSAIPLGGYCKISGFTPEDEDAPVDPNAPKTDPNDPTHFLNKPAWRRFLVIAAGPGVNYLAAFVILLLLYVSVGGRDLSVLRLEVMPDGAAQAAGMQTGDIVTSIDGVPVHDLSSLSGELHKVGPEVRKVAVDRAGTPVVLDVKPRNGLIGVVHIGNLLVVPLSAAFGRSLDDLRTLNHQTIFGFLALFRGGGGGLSGPLGIIQQASEAVKHGLSAFGSMLAALSVSLAVFNFLPIPALDGGRLVFLGYEIITRKKPNQRLELVLHTIGFLLLVGLLVSVTLFGDLKLLDKLKHLFGK